MKLGKMMYTVNHQFFAASIFRALPIFLYTIVQIGLFLMFAASIFRGFKKIREIREKLMHAKN